MKFPSSGSWAAFIIEMGISIVPFVIHPLKDASQPIFDTIKDLQKG
jgi:hypothetical protein